MRKLLAVLMLLGLAGSAYAQITTTQMAYRFWVYRLRTGNQWTELTAIPNDTRDTSRGVWTMDTGGILGVGCSLKINSGGSVTMGVLSSMDGTNYTYEDSTILANATTTAGFRTFRCNLPYANNYRITVANHGSDTVWIKFVGQATIGRN